MELRYMKDLYNLTVPYRLQYTILVPFQYTGGASVYWKICTFQLQYKLSYSDVINDLNIDMDDLAHMYICEIVYVDINDQSYCLMVYYINYDEAFSNAHSLGTNSNARLELSLKKDLTYWRKKSKPSQRIEPGSPDSKAAVLLTELYCQLENVAPNVFI